MVGELVILNWLKQKAREGRAREDGDRIIFYVPLPAWLFMAGGTFVLIVVEIVTSSVPGVPRWQEFALPPIIFLFLWHWPNAVILSSTGISKRNFLGIPRTIPWHDVRTLDLAARKQQAHVGEGTGLRIAFTAFHVDLQRFVEEIRRRAPGVNFTSDL
jgi:hypothetical protein